MTASIASLMKPSAPTRPGRTARWGTDWIPWAIGFRKRQAFSASRLPRSAVTRATGSCRGNVRPERQHHDFGRENLCLRFENRLKSMKGGTVTMVYDDDCNRVAKTVGGVTTRFLVDDLDPTGYAQ